ncbi:MAG: cysteine synthase A [Desulfobulbus propionicus]|nr:MAG: cysteine synthase A [Desulfobulbus propionicus]
MNTFVSDIAKTVGETPLVQLRRFSLDTGANIFAKIEAANPLGSVKDRLALAMLERAEKDGLITPATTIIEPTSGNTGIGLAFLCARRGYRLRLTMPENMSMERRKLLAHLGAELVLTPAKKGMRGAVAMAEELHGSMADAFLPNQFGNPVGPAMHKETTGQEIWRQTQGKVDIFVAGVGTGGTITGVGWLLKECNPDVLVIAVEPGDSPVLSGGQPGPHKIQGIGAGFVPAILDRSVIDEVLQVDNDEAVEYARRVAGREGILCGISSGAAAACAVKIAQCPENAGKNIVTVFPDTGERYISTELMSNPG